VRTLILSVVLFVCGCVCMSSTGGVECESPHIRFGEGCCLDRNDNGVCDSDEVAEIRQPAPARKPSETTVTTHTTATTQSTATTSTIDSTTISPTTLYVSTSSTVVACRKDADCGGETFKCGAYFCRDGDVYRTCKIMGCYNPGQADSFCAKVDRDLLQDNCGKRERCEEGKRECQ
jgi:hypothetical protein